MQVQAQVQVVQVVVLLGNGHRDSANTHDIVKTQDTHTLSHPRLRKDHNHSHVHNTQAYERTTFTHVSGRAPSTGGGPVSVKNHFEAG